MHNIWMGNEIPSTLQSYYSTAKFRPSIHLSINLSMGALLDVCIAIFKACLALSSYILEFMRNIWIGNEILSIIQLYNSKRNYLWIDSSFKVQKSKICGKAFLNKETLFYVHTRSKTFSSCPAISSTRKYLSEAPLFAENGENMLCTIIVLNVRNNFCTQYVLPRFEFGIFMY